MSAIGRWQMWKITLLHLKDHFWLGTGLGRFTLYYPGWQAQYFKSTPNISSVGFLSASESYIIFNEYLQLFKEIGIIGFLFFCWVIYDFYRSASLQHKRLLLMLKLTMTGILIPGLFSYPFHVTIFLFILMLLTITMGAIREERFYLSKAVAVPKYLRYYKAVLTLSMLPLCLLCLRERNAIVHWNTLMEDDIVNREERKTAYQRLYHSLKLNGKFLISYGEFLSADKNDLATSISMLENSQQFFISARGYTDLAEIYQKSGNYQQAIKYYTFLSCFLPNRFAPKVQLLRLYLEEGKQEKARSMIDVILTMPVKIPSGEVNQIISEVRQIKRDLNKGAITISVE